MRLSVFRNLPRHMRGFSAARLTVDRLPRHVVETQYAVRGAIVIRSGEIDAELKSGKGSYPFSEVVPCNIGNPQAVGQKAITFYRQVLSVLCNPGLLDTSHGLPEDVVARAKMFLEAQNVGAYSNSKGIAVARQEVARFIDRRDRVPVPANVEHIFLSNGASEAVKAGLSLLINDPNDAIMVPVPQYPLYSAAVRLMNGHFLGYYLEEESGWSTTASGIKKTIEEFRQKNPQGRVRALVVINPGNPTGQLMSVDDMKEVVDLCEKEGIVLLADEVYQDNIWTEKKSWSSFRKVALEKQSNVELMSFHSVSKGFYGECGFRGGYVEAINIDAGVLEQVYKLASLSLCSNTMGQAMMALVTNPPSEGEPSFPLYQQERDAIMSSLKRKAKLVTTRLNAMDGVSCQEVEGAMYAFPKLTLPPKAVEAAAQKGQAPDFMYCMDMLEQTGVVVVPGSGFEQLPGTHHYRMTILPDEGKLPGVLDRMEEFHNAFLKKYA